MNTYFFINCILAENQKRVILLEIVIIMLNYVPIIGNYVRYPHQGNQTPWILIKHVLITNII